MSKKDAPAMPGLLYEAELPQNATRPGQKKRRSNSTSNEAEGGSSGGGDIESNREQVPDVDSNSAESIDADSKINDNNNTAGLTTLHCEENNADVASATALVGDTTASVTLDVKKDTEKPITEGQNKKSKRNKPSTADENATVPSECDSTTKAVVPQPQQSKAAEAQNGLGDSFREALTTTVPLAIAKVYKLPIALPDATTSSSIDTSHPKAYLEQELTSDQLRMNVDVQFPRGGGRIETTLNNQNESRYLVYDRNGDLKRTLLVTEVGKVMEQRTREGEEKGSNNIKLGLGDFIFYSVLVSKAAENGFAAFVACFLAILTGLGGTLVLLAVYHHALPALPISIFLAVGFFVLTTYCMEPWIHMMWQAPFYV